MIDKRNLVATTNTALLGCITPSIRMIKILLSDAEKKFHVVAYFESPPKDFEKELIMDISGEVESSLITLGYECRATLVQIESQVIGNPRVDILESKLCDSIAFSEVCYLRFGEEGGYDDLSSESFETLEPQYFYFIP